MTRAKDISKIVTDADLSGTLDVTGTVTAGGLTVDTNTLYVDSANNRVGIGETSPLGILHIKEGDSGVSSVSTDADQLVIENNAESGISILAPTNSASRIAFGDSDDNKIGMIYYNHSSNFMKFDVNGSERMRIISSGFTKHSDSGTYRGVSGNYHEMTTSTSGGGNVSAFLNASYADGGIQSIATRASAGSTYRFFEGYSNSAADREFRVDSDGTVRADGAYSSAGGDYAEMFEWKDGNTNSEDRVGKTVVLDGNQIRLSTSDDAKATIIGVVSARPVILGDAHDEKWIGKYETDSYGRYVFEEYTQTEWTEEDEDGNKSLKSYQTDLIPSDITVPSDAIVTSTEVDGETPLTRRKLNSSYDPSQTYTPRVERKEFSAIGLVGKLRVSVGQTVGDRWIKMREISNTVHEYLVR